MAEDKPRADGSPSAEQVLAALSQVMDPELGRDVVSLGMIRDVTLKDGHVSFKFVLTTPACPMRGELQKSAEEAVAGVPGVKSVSVDMSAEVQATRAVGPEPVEGVKNIIAVASNKGGVGKSTVAVNLAVALSQHGARVGLLDADITGPNLPTMMGVQEGFQAEVGLSIVERYGVRLASLGFMLKKGLPIIWRGPMLGKAISQLLRDLPWGEDGDLDYLVIDLPPGTSDAPLSMSQEAPIAGTVIVTTPQSVSLEDATKAVNMFQKLEVPVFGVVENMSYFLCPHCGERTDVFGHGGAKAAADELGLDFLGEIPLNARLRESSDSGVPIVNSDPDSPEGQAFMEIARRVAAKASVQRFAAEPATPG
jgi:ATP-binding protein involved in chromosome partitioning